MFQEIVLKPLLNSAQRYSQNNAFFIDETYYSYRNFIERTATIVMWLSNVEEANIGILSNNDLDTYASIFAVWFLNKSYVPLQADSPEERNQTIIDRVNLNLIIDSNQTKLLGSIDYDQAIALLSDTTHKFDYDKGLAYILFTSGSTGTPKGVEITKANVANFTNAFWAMGYEVNQQDRVLQMFDLTFDLSVMSYLIPLLKGACLYTVPKDKIKYAYIFKLLDEQELTVALMVPSILNYLRPYFEEIDCPKMRYSLFCGEALHCDIVDEWAKCVPNARIDNVYGPTEDTIFCTQYTYKRHTTNKSRNGILSIGKPMLNNLAIVFNDDGSRSDIDTIGELCLAGSQLTLGYFENPVLNANAFFHAQYDNSTTRFYKTGDLCVMCADGNIDYVGRKDTQTKIQGFRVELSEVEFHVSKASDVSDPLIALSMRNSLGNYEIAIVFEGLEFDLSNLKQSLTSKIPSYMIPTQYFFIRQFPLNSNGKVDRNALGQMIKNS